MGCVQINLYQQLSPGMMAGAKLFSIYISSIAVGVELIRQLDIVAGKGLRYFLGLTCVFWAGNAEKTYKLLTLNSFSV